MFCPTETPGVVVDSVAVTLVATPQPSFAIVTGSLMHSSLLITPLLLAALSSIVEETKSNTGEPVRQKFRVAVPPLAYRSRACARRQYA